MYCSVLFRMDMLLNLALMYVSLVLSDSGHTMICL